MIRKTVLVAITTSLLTLNHAMAETLKIGWMTTLSGGLAPLAKQMTDGFMLGVENLGGKLGGLETEIIQVDDQLKPDVAVELAKRLTTRDNVHIIAGVLASNILMSIYKPLREQNAIFISANAGPSPIAGKLCTKSIFVASYQNDQVHAAVGAYVQRLGKKKMVLIAPDYQGGKDAIAGFKARYAGEVAGEIMTKLQQEDFSAEISRISSLKPDGVLAFLPGGLGITFVKQWIQAGLKDTIPLYTSFMFNALSIPAFGDAATGFTTATFWAPEIKNSQNEKFYKSFKAKYGYEPIDIAAAGYDTANLIDGAIRSTGGMISDKETLISALHAAKFESVRGNFSFNNNNFPIQDFYITEVKKDDQGLIRPVMQELLLPNDKDAFSGDCPTQW